MSILELHSCSLWSTFSLRPSLCMVHPRLSDGKSGRYSSWIQHKISPLTTSVLDTLRLVCSMTDSRSINASWHTQWPSWYTGTSPQLRKPSHEGVIRLGSLEKKWYISQVRLSNILSPGLIPYLISFTPFKTNLNPCESWDRGACHITNNGNISNVARPLACLSVATEIRAYGIIMSFKMWLISPCVYPTI